jgi:hypothetical protein
VGARNVGLAVTSTPYVAFVDSDVEVHAEALLLLTGHFADPSVVLVGPRVVGHTHALRVRQESALLLRHWWAATAVGVVVSASARRAVATAVLVDLAVLHHEVDDLPGRDVVAHVAARWLDHLAYGAGLWRGAVGARSARALLPKWVVRHRG